MTHTTYRFSDRESLFVPFEQFAHNSAANPKNPVDGIGILHNAIFTLAMTEITNNRYRGLQPTGDAIYLAVVEVIRKAPLWDLDCICVIQEGCPCPTLLDWLRSNFPIPTSQPTPFPRDSFPDSRVGHLAVEKMVTESLECQAAESVIKYNRELHAAIDKVRSQQCGIAEFQRRVVELEAEVINATLEPFAQQVFLMSSSVARHSMFLALTSGNGPAEAPEWVGDDADGATAGAITGSPGGPKGAVAGAAIGAAIFSLATATGWW